MLELNPKEAFAKKQLEDLNRNKAEAIFETAVDREEHRASRALSQ